MENKEIVETKLQHIDYHHVDKHIITLSGIMETDIVVRFISDNRKDTSYVIEFKNQCRELVYGDTVTYAAERDMYKKVLRDIEEILAYCEISLPKVEANKIGDLICKCISKCEGRYGNHVKDYYDNDADAVLIIKGVDNGKPKHKVTIFNSVWEKTNPEDYDVGELKGRSIFVEDVDNKNYVIWLIEKESISFEDLLIHLMCEFDNPYLMIEPSKELNIILDFKLNTDLYNVTM